MRDPEYLTPEQLAARWEGAVTLGGLANWRSQGKGPKFSKIGRRVRYALSDVQDYEQACVIAQPKAEAA